MGTVAHCLLAEGTCATALDSDLKYPNGIVKPGNPSDKLYVANTAKGFVSYHLIGPAFVYPRIPSTISPVRNPIKIGMPIDNLSVDSKGDIYVAGFPDMLGVLRAMRNSDKETDVASSVFRIRQILVRDEKAEKDGLEEGQGGRLEHVVEKVIEDREGKLLPAASTVVHDVTTGSLWLSGFASKFITVCEAKPS